MEMYKNNGKSVLTVTANDGESVLQFMIDTIDNSCSIVMKDSEECVVMEMTKYEFDTFVKGITALQVK